MSDDLAGCFVVLLLTAFLAFAALLVRWEGKDAGYKQGYQRGFCEGRGGVQVEVADTLACIQPPQPVRTR